MSENPVSPSLLNTAGDPKNVVSLKNPSLEGTTVETPHPEFKRYADTWQRIRDCIAGVDQVKNQGVLYLPQLSDMEPADYQNYKRRAKFVNFTKMTSEMLQGLIFKRDPMLQMPDDLEEFLEDCTLSGKSFDAYMRDVVGDVINLGRRGTLIDWSEDEKAPYCAPYSTEQIINWKTMRHKGEMVLSLLVLQEEIPTPQSESPNAFSHDSISQWRVYRLDLQAGGSGEPIVICDVWQKNEREDFFKVSTDIPTRRGDSLHRIPFVFHGAVNSEPDVDPPPMGDISDLNIKHYCLSADLENGRHFCGLPTPYAICFDFEDAENVRVGSSLVWQSGNEKAKVGYLEFHGEGLKSLETGIVETEEQLSAMGARMLEKQKGDEAYQTVLMRQSGQMAALIGTSTACSESLTLVAQWAEWWMSTAKEPEDLEKVEVDLNADFIDVQLTRGEIQEMWQTCQQGGISRLTFHEFLQKAEVIPADRDLDEELALIQAQPPPGMLQMGSGVPAQTIPGGTKKPPGQQGSGSQEGGTGPGGGSQQGNVGRNKNQPSFEEIQSGGGGTDHPTA